MNINLVSLVMQNLTPDMTAKIASALGIDKSPIGKAVGAAVPSLLGGFVGTTSTQEGSRKLFDAVNQQQPDVLNSLAGTITGSGQKALVDNGTNMLSHLLGPSTVSTIASAVGTFAGLGAAESSSLLGLLAPVVIGALGKQTAAQGLNAQGLAQLLTSQKSAVASAMPSGFSNLLKGTGLLDSLSTGVAGAMPSSRSTDELAAYKADRAVKQAPSIPARVSWALPVIAVIAALGWWFLGRPDTNVADKTTTNQSTQSAQSLVDKTKSATQSVEANQNLRVGAVDVGAEIQTAIGSLKQTLQGVTDVPTAKAALPKLQDATVQLDKVSGLVDKLPASGKTALATVISAARPSLDDMFRKVLAVPGVAEVAQPSIDMVKSRLDALTKATA
jgi:hypothetical protein